MNKLSLEGNPETFSHVSRIGILFALALISACDLGPAEETYTSRYGPGLDSGIGYDGGVRPLIDLNQIPPIQVGTRCRWNADCEPNEFCYHVIERSCQVGEAFWLRKEPGYCLRPSCGKLSCFGDPCFYDWHCGLGEICYYNGFCTGGRSLQNDMRVTHPACGRTYIHYAWASHVAAICDVCPEDAPYDGPVPECGFNAPGRDSPSELGCPRADWGSIP